MLDSVPMGVLLVIIVVGGALLLGAMLFAVRLVGERARKGD